MTCACEGSRSATERRYLGPLDVHLQQVDPVESVPLAQRIEGRGRYFNPGGAIDDAAGEMVVALADRHGPFPISDGYLLEDHVAQAVGTNEAVEPTEALWVGLDGELLTGLTDEPRDLKGLSTSSSADVSDDVTRLRPVAVEEVQVRLGREV